MMVSTTHRRRVLALLSVLFEPQEALRWLATPQPQFGGEAPAKLLNEEGRGAEVFAVVRRLASNPFV